MENNTTPLSDAIETAIAEYKQARRELENLYSNTCYDNPDWIVRVESAHRRATEAMKILNERDAANHEEN